MLQYVAFTWDSENAECAHRAHALGLRLQGASRNWRVTPEIAGLLIYYRMESHASSDAYVLRQGAGVVLGTLFHRGADTVGGEYRAVTAFDDEQSLGILKSRGRRLIDDYWGSYVAFLSQSTSSTRWVVRSPANAPPCEYTEVDGIHILFSRIDNCDALGLPLSIHWENVAAHCAYARRPWGETALKEVRELELGECLTLERNTTLKTSYWNPGDIARSGTIERFSEAADLLKQATQGCVRAWASRYQGVLLRLSGGLDSSIVLSCLCEQPRSHFSAVHYFGESAAADEREYARAAAEMMQCHLIERPLITDIKIDSVLSAARSSTPIGYGPPQQNRLQVEIAKSQRASAVFCGTWGDLLFHQAPAAPAATEYLRRHGLDRNLFNVVLDVAYIQRLSVWEVLKRAVRDGFLAAPDRNWDPSELRKLGGQPKDRLLSAGAIEGLEISRFIHPWLKSVKGIPSGKLWMIYGLPFDDYWRNPFYRWGDPEEIPPFISEPIIEVCLRIPTYLSIRNGLDRAVARDAFSASLPPKITRRIAKGTPDSTIRQIIDRNAKQVREILLDGLLVKQGVLDRSRVEQAMPGGVTVSPSAVGLILEHLSTEAWVRQWSGHTRRAAA